ncbi:hypothetical protein QQ045_000901 [Rhodiola kirilowii]
MSAKLLYSLTDDKKEMKKHMGCMNGLLQLFDRHHFMVARRRRLPPPGDCQQTLGENALHKTKRDNPRLEHKDTRGVSCEPPYSSSTCSSTYDSNKMATPQPASSSPSIAQEMPMIHTESSQSPNLNRRADHLRDIVRGSIKREVPGLFVITPSERGTRSVVKHIDSPRPSLPSTPTKSKVSGLDESFKNLRKFQEIHSEGKDKSLLLTRKEAYRFSCDGRVTNLQDTLKSSLKLKEQPRLSLDSRASSVRMRSQNDNYTSQKVEHESDSSRHTSIVAKLMGLDITTESMFKGNSNQTNETSSTDKHASQQSLAFDIRNDPNKNSSQFRNHDTTMKPILTSRILVEAAPWKDAARGLQKPGFGEATKNIPNSMPSVYGEMEKRVTELEFKKSSRDLRALKQILGAMQKSKDNLQMKKEHPSDSMSQSSNTSTICNSHHQELKSAGRPNLSGNCSRSVANGVEGPQKRRSSHIVVMKPANSLRNQQIKTSAESTTESLSGLRKLRTPDVRGHGKDFVDKHIPSDRNLTSHLREASSPTLRTDKNSVASPRTPRIKNSKLTQPLAAESNYTGQSLGVVSPRLQQKQLRFDKKVQQTSLSPEPIRTKGQPSEAGSPVKRIQLRASNLRKHDNKSTEVLINSCSSIQLHCSSRSDSNISQSSEFIRQVTSIADLDEMNAASFWKSDFKQGNKSARSGKCRAMSELSIIAPEQPSPVSVLDDTFYRDESPSPVKKISNDFIDDEFFNPEEQGWSIKQGTSDSTRSLASNDYDSEKVYNGEHLFEEQVGLYSTTFGNSADYGLPNCEDKDQDHGYILQILLASSLLQEPRCGLKTEQLHQSGHAIKPEIFKILEMKNTKLYINPVSKQSLHIDKIHRKLIFDTVNEILGRKLVQSSYNDLSLLSSKVADISQAKQKLVKDLCSEINQLQVTQSDCNYDDEYDEGLRTLLLEDMQQHEQYRSEFQGELSGLVLDVERLIFKDLISEIITDTAEGPRTRYTGHCRQLFSK